ncbi:hypothetical protein NQ176_g899 [Zarea fungicola]|uniref:Uncharacterized protein n=1 Tax=Zarea fungicola TaxID=93591 RepID=A0ACC1NW37_9HYPO|nr:hypothetical protein NQ176_g899 [Lecanicillium fungicola]
MTTQPILIAPYSHEVYHTVTPSSLHEARQIFTSTGAQDAINTTIRDCFLKHKVEKQFSACVNHRHFDIEPNERNIDLAGQAAASSNLNNIHACSWLFYNGALYPYEFKRLPPGQSIAEPPQDFRTDLGHILEKKGLCDIIGLQSYSEGVVGVESTDHDTRVSTTVDHDESFDPSAHRGKIQMASFAFF